MKTIKLTPCQTVAMDKLGKFIKQDEESVFLLYGAAGTGKTFIMQELVKLAKPSTIRATAPTHKAVHVLKERVNGIQTRTIQSLLGLKLTKDNGTYKLKQDLNSYAKSMEGVELVLVDEASMIDNIILDFIYTDINSSDRKYIFIGDICQLPPVNYEVSPIFEEVTDEDYLAELVTPVRQYSDSSILENANSLRVKIFDDISTKFKYDANFEKLQSNEFVKRLKAHKWVDDDSRIVAWRNVNVKAYNKLVNNVTGVPTEQPFKVGQDVVFSSAYAQDDYVIANAGDVVKVDKITKRYDSKYKLHCFEVEIEADYFSDKQVESAIFVLDEQSQQDYDALVISYRHQAITKQIKWASYYDLIESYVDLRPTFSSTVHKTQGETIAGVVFIDMVDIYRNSDEITRDRMVYTAITRATTNVVIRV